MIGKLSRVVPKSHSLFSLTCCPEIERYRTYLIKFQATAPGRPLIYKDYILQETMPGKDIDSMLYQDCVDQAGGSNETALILECVTKGLLAQDQADRQYARTIGLVYGAALVVGNHSYHLFGLN